MQPHIPPVIFWVLLTGSVFSSLTSNHPPVHSMATNQATLSSQCTEGFVTAHPNDLYQRIQNTQPLHFGGQSRIYTLEGAPNIYKVISYGNSNPFVQQMMFKNAMKEFRSLFRVAGKSCFLQLKACYHYPQTQTLILETERLDHDLGSLQDAAEPTNYLNLMLQAAYCVNQLHALDIAHNDIKPQNLAMLKGAVKVIDFGLASRLGERADGGTKGYLPKEYVLVVPDFLSDDISLQKNAVGSRERDAYALGVTFATFLLGYDQVFHNSEGNNRLWKLEDLYVFQEGVSRDIRTQVAEAWDAPQDVDKRNLLRMTLELIRDDPRKRLKLPEAISFLSELTVRGTDALSPDGTTPLAEHYWGPPPMHGLRLSSLSGSSREGDLSFI